MSKYLDHKSVLKVFIQQSKVLQYKTNLKFKKLKYKGSVLIKTDTILVYPSYTFNLLYMKPYKIAGLAQLDTIFRNDNFFSGK